MQKLFYYVKKSHIFILVLFAIVFMGLLIFFHTTIHLAPLNPAGKAQFAKATVIKVISSDAEQNSEMQGNQVVQLKITSGPFRGKVSQAFSPNVSNSGALCVPGLKVIVRIVQRGNGSLDVSVYNYDRGLMLWILVGLFFFLLCLTGGRKGIASTVALIFTFICIIFMYIPMIYIGVSPFLAASFTAVLVTVITMLLIGGWSKKTICAILGAMAGILIAGLLALFFGSLSRISGMNVEQIEVLTYIGRYSKMNIKEILFSGILISSLGAVMDISMSISSTISEIHDSMPDFSAQRLFQSGMRVGRDMMGTMSTTLILAFAGGSINTLIIIYSYSMPYLQYINDYAIGIDILSGISGSIGVILSVPFVSAISSVFMCRKEKTH